MKKMLLWIGALTVGVVLGWLGIAWLDGLMNFVAMVYTRFFQLLAVPTIVLAVVSTFATFGSQDSGKIFGRTVTYTLLTTLSAAIVGALLHVAVGQPVQLLFHRRLGRGQGPVLGQIGQNHFLVFIQHL